MVPWTYSGPSDSAAVSKLLAGTNALCLLIIVDDSNSPRGEDSMFSSFQVPSGVQNFSHRHLVTWFS